MLEMLKHILGITDNSQDEYLSTLLVESQGYVEDYLNRELSLAEYQDYVTPNGSNSFTLRNYPVQSVELIEHLDGTEVTEYKFVKTPGMVRTKQVLFGDYLIDYTAGYDPLPMWAMKAIVDTAVGLHGLAGAGSTSSAPTGAIKSEEIVGVAKITYDTGSSAATAFSVGGGVGALPASVVQLLEPHRNRYA